ncbi:PQQ-dependent sugar dehydrogenase [Planococcus dechangensis]|uniref:PQQ-dependent sugar dehydrogenase n=1 Tax=Planococcus dechangensis TaxID=1176255 RepID=A0ABV9M910_9BACL
MKKWLFPGILAIALTGCSNSPANPDEATAPADAIATDLDAPWSINKHDDVFYVSERPGTVAFIDPQGNVERQAVNFASPLSSASEAGFLGFVLKPDFSESQEAYGYYVYEENGNSYNKIASFRLEDGSWSETDVLLAGIPTGNVHHGGRLEIDDNGILYATVGDASDPELAQDPASVNGKILRLNEFGEFEIYSRGHRNPQGIAWLDGVMYASEHGQSANDEINIIEQDANYGWPDIEGEETAEGMEAPFATSGADHTWAPSGIDFHNGSLYIAALRGTAIEVLDPETAEIIDSIEGYGRIRDVHSDGDNLYFITNNTDGRGTPSDGDDKLYILNEQ